MADLKLIQDLLMKAHETHARDHTGQGGDVEFEVAGWTVVLFYDAGELDYISEFKTPDGEVIDVWPNNDGWLDPRIDDRDEDNPSSTLMMWNGRGGTEQLLMGMHKRSTDRAAKAFKAERDDADKQRIKAAIEAVSAALDKLTDAQMQVDSIDFEVTDEAPLGLMIDNYIDAARRSCRVAIKHFERLV